jgi:hypothetical protein
MTEKTFKIQCKTCGGVDLCDLNGVYISKHECQMLNTNQLLLRIARALEDCHCERCWNL